MEKRFKVSWQTVFMSWMMGFGSCLLVFATAETPPPTPVEVSVETQPVVVDIGEPATITKNFGTETPPPVKRMSRQDSLTVKELARTMSKGFDLR